MDFPFFQASIYVYRSSNRTPRVPRVENLRPLWIEVTIPKMAISCFFFNYPFPDHGRFYEGYTKQQYISLVDLKIGD